MLIDYLEVKFQLETCSTTIERELSVSLLSMKSERRPPVIEFSLKVRIPPGRGLI